MKGRPLYVCVAATIAGTAVAQTGAIDPGKGLELSLRLDANEVVCYEPLRVVVVLRNVSVDSMRINPDGEFRQCLTSFRSLDGGEFTWCGCGAESRSFGMGFLNVRPGDELMSPEVIFLYVPQEGRERPFSFAFDRPGNWRLKVRLAFRGTCLESEPVCVFAKPVPPDHREAAELITEMRVAACIQGWPEGASAHGKLEELIAKFPNSMYADHARYEVGRYWAAGYRSSNRELGKKAYNLLSTVSPRIGALRARVLVRMAELVGKAYALADPFGAIGPDEVASPDDAARLWAEIEGYTELIAAIGADPCVQRAKERIEQAKEKAKILQAVKRKRSGKQAE